ncbi:MAG: DUF2062 domain-containing protein [Deltaproteobacteria bacterium]|nr:DUF2062 domain-containing protein [Deltaproteobacteria bacterium]
MTRDRDRTLVLMRRRLREAQVTILRRIPRKRHLRDTWVHRRFGERLFDPEIWHVGRPGVAGGLAVGVLISFTPLIGLHMVMAALAAYVLRLNLPAALVGAWFMNPVTAPVLLVAVYKVGAALDWLPEIQLGTGYPAAFRKLLHQLAELSLGGLVLGAAAAAATYALVTVSWAPARWALARSGVGHPQRTPGGERQVDPRVESTDEAPLRGGRESDAAARSDVDRSAH